MPQWQRGIMRALRIPSHKVTVCGIEDITPYYRRVTFLAPELIACTSFFPTHWLRLWVEDAARGGALVQRGYTFTGVNSEAGTFALELVIHDTEGPAMDWVRQVAVGDICEVSLTPKEVKLPPQVTHLVLAGDLTALPAINSWLLALPDSMTIDVFLEDEHSDIHLLPQVRHPGAQWHWLTPDGSRGQALSQAVSKVAGGTDLFLWAAGEKGLVKRIREVVRGDLGLAKTQYYSQFYWIEGKRFG